MHEPGRDCGRCGRVGHRGDVDMCVCVEGPEGREGSEGARGAVMLIVASRLVECKLQALKELAEG